jgi:SAM-dependent methyltransferase
MITNNKNFKIKEFGSMYETHDIPMYNEEVFRKKETIAHLPPLERIKLRGYRSYVGAHNAEDWYQIGRLQYFFLILRGLKPQHKLLDLGCGSLRLGQYLIPFLEAGNYYGLEPEEILVKCGLEREISNDIIIEKRPKFSHNYEFKFEDLNYFDFAIANSVLTHLNPRDIKICFDQTLQKTKPSSVFYFTFFEGSSEKNIHSVSHANRGWHYSFEELQSYADGWKLTYIGKWQHPRNQKMVKACPI